jgi:hypothetical protein
MLALACRLLRIAVSQQSVDTNNLPDRTYVKSKHVSNEVLNISTAQDRDLVNRMSIAAHQLDSPLIDALTLNAIDAVHTLIHSASLTSVQTVTFVMGLVLLMRFMMPAMTLFGPIS